jgi:quinol monooxygenase YgiN
MFMRLVQVRVREGFLPAVTRLYSRAIAPALATAPGCRYAGLLQSVHHSDECLSLTVWDSEADANAYEQSGLFSTLIDQTRPFQAESSELRLQLSQDLKLEYLPVPGTPVVSSLPVAAAQTSPPGEHPLRTLWVRVVSLKIRPGKREEFKALYADKAIPALRGLKGCVYVYLAEKEDAPDEVLSFTGWDSRENAERYERGGMFDQLLESQKALLSNMYQLKRAMQGEGVGPTVTSDDVRVESYTVLVEESFEGRPVDRLNKRT